MENGIAGYAAGEPDIAHCGHLRLRSRAQQHSKCAILLMTMAPLLGQETRKNVSSDYETISGIAQNDHACREEDLDQCRCTSQWQR